MKKYPGIVVECHFKPDPDTGFKEKISSLNGKRVEVSIDEFSDGITANQRNYFFGVIVNILHSFFVTSGTRCDKSDVVDYIKDKWLFRESFSPLCSSIIKTPISLSDSSGGMTKKEFSEKKEQIQEFAATVLDVVIPDPLPNYKMYKNE